MSSNAVEECTSQEASLCAPEDAKSPVPTLIPPTGMDSVEYEEYFSRKAHESVDRIVARIVKRLPHIAPGKTWLTLDSDQQRTVKSTCVEGLRLRPNIVDVDLEDERIVDDMMRWIFGWEMVRWTYPEGLKTKIKIKKTGNNLLKTAIRKSTDAKIAMMLNSDSDRLKTSEN